MVRPGLLAGPADDLLRESDLAGNLHGKRTARLARLQLEERPDVLHVEQHRTVGNPLRIRRIVFDIGVVGRDDAVAPLLQQAFENRLGNRPADDRLGARPELVDQHQGPRRGSGKHVLHVEQVGGVGREVVVDRLLVADVDAEALEDGQLGDLRRRDREPALEHVLDDAGGLQADGFPAGIGTRNDEDVLAAVQLQVERDDFAPGGPQGLLQERMAGIFEHQPVVGREDRPHASVLRGPAPLGAQHVHLGQVVARRGDQLRIGTDPFGELREDAHNLAPFGIFQLTQFVVDLHHLDRFDIEGLSGGRFVVDEAVELAFVRGRDGDHGTPVADRDLRVALDDSRPLGGGQYGLQPFGGLPLAFADRTADLLQRRGGIVPHVAEAVDDRLDAPHDLREGLHAPRAGMERRVTLRTVQDERHDAADRREGTAEGDDLLHVEERTLDAQFGDKLIDIGILPAGEVALHFEHQTHFVCQGQAALDLTRGGRKALRGNPFAGGLHRTTFGNLFPQAVEPDFLLESGWIDHV